MKWIETLYARYIQSASKQDGAPLVGGVPAYGAVLELDDL